MMTWQKDNAVDAKKAVFMTAEMLAGKIIIGELKNTPSEEYTDRYEKIIEKAGGKSL